MNHYGWQELELGLKHEFKAKITEEMMQYFLAVTGDSNPLHLDSTYAEKRGFPNKVVYGLLTASFYSTLVGVHLPGQNSLLHGIDIAFMKPVFVGDELTIVGEVTYLNEAYKQAHMSAHITSQQGQVVSKARIKVGVLE